MEIDKNNLPKIIDLPSTRIRDLTGQTFELLKVIGYVGNDNKGKSTWLCQCGCDNHTFKVVVGTELTKGKTKSCGCFAIEATRQRSITHGMSKSRIYTLYRGMIERCYNKNGKDYERYGGRGINICEEWLGKENGFVNFYNWSIKNGYHDLLSIDRIDVNGNYEPNNCRWVTLEVQNGNKTTACKITYEGKEYNLLDFYNEKKPKISYSTFKQRVFKFNWDVDDALNIPKNTSKEFYNFEQYLEYELSQNNKLFTVKEIKNKYNINDNTFGVWIKRKDIKNILTKYNYKYINTPIFVASEE